MVRACVKRVTGFKLFHSMLFDSSLRKDLARQFVATVVVVLTIVMTVMLIRTLGHASKGSINPAEVLLVMGLNIISQLGTVLALSLFIAVIATLSRMYSDSEMVVWFSGGRSLWSFVPPLLRFAWPVVLATLALTLVAWPWSNQQLRELQARYDQRSDVERVAPGRFQESSGGKLVFFIDKDSPDPATGTNVFVSRLEGTSVTTTTARQGRVHWVGNDRFLSLQDGEQWLTDDASAEVRWTQFAQYDLLLGSAKAPSTSAASSRQTPSLGLVQTPSPAHLGELSWRIGVGVCALNFVLLALPLSAVNPRRGRSYQFGLALLVFVIYYNLINAGQNAIAQSHVDFWAWTLGLHGSATALALLAVGVQQSHWSWRDALAKWPRKGAA